MTQRTNDSQRLHEIDALRDERLFHEAWRPSFNPWIIALSVMLATFMEVLDTSVANVALPHIAGSLSATTNEATWVLTSYLVSNAIVLPSTGWLTSHFGRRRTLISCIFIFTFASMLCGMANSLSMLIVARVLQGIGGGALQPIAQATLLESFPPQQRGPAMAVFGIGVVCAPIIGPTLGGWITDNYSWRWIFYINLPVGILAMFMARAFVEDPPYLKSSRAPLDYIGFGFMAVGLGALQILLDKGQESDWFGSTFICYLAVIAAVALLAFGIRQWYTPRPLVNLRIFTDRNFLIGTIMITFLGVVLYGTTALLPLLLQTLMGYPATQSGLAVSPRGLGSLVATVVVGNLIRKIDMRVLLCFGFAILTYAMIYFGRINLDIATSNIQWPNIISGFALGFIFVPLTTSTMGTLPNTQVRNATGIYNLMRNLGGSFGIAAVTTMLARGAQRSQLTLSAHTTPYSPEFRYQLRMISHMAAHYFGTVGGTHAAQGILYQILSRQSEMLSYLVDFRTLTILCALCIPTPFLFRKVTVQAGSVAAD
ncbi:MAG: DHA2 family efflux MFS transporter permease subunit [Tepidisphaeraceae bacterium]|jgi:DHA2 family multidrug resistance protein